MKISVAICTRNRARSLARTLESLTMLHSSPDADWELLVVDNGSTDETADVVLGFADRLPVRRISEPMAGLSNARNRAVAEATGEYIVWTDDDVLIDPDWLVAYAEAFRAHPDAAVFGGKILPRLTPPTPQWFTDALPQLRDLLAYRDFGDVPVILRPGRVMPFGANYAVRMREQRSVLYDPAFGASPNHRRLAEETIVVTSILDSGGTGMWIPRPVVHHCISPGRQTVRHAIDYYRSQGATVAAREPFYECQLWFGVPRWLWLRLSRRFLRYRYDRLTQPPQTWAKSLIRYSQDRGVFDHWRTAGKKPSPASKSRHRVASG